MLPFLRIRRLELSLVSRELEFQDGLVVLKAQLVLGFRA